MVQVFGNRIIGGIGAPGGGMSESFGAGVSTTLGQRRARQSMDEAAQAMRIREQEFAWRGEDREEAKRRRQAAEAAAAAAKARQAAIFGAATGGGVTPFFQLGGSEARAPAAGASRGGTLPMSMGETVGVAPAPAPRIGAMPRGGAGLSMGETVGGGGGQTGLRGDPGGDLLPAGDVVVPPVAPAVPPAGVRVPMLAAEDAARAARAQAMFPTDPVDPEAEAARRAAAAEQRAQRDARRAQELVAAARTAEGAGRPELAEQLRTQAGILAAATVQGRDTFALEGPEVAGTYLTEAPTDTPLEDVIVPSQAGLSFGAGVPQAPLPQGGQMTFGPQLGAAPTPTEMFLADLNLQPPGQLSLSDLMQDYASPLADPRNARLLEQNRAMWAAVAQDAYARRDLGAYSAALAKVQEQEDLILATQLSAAVREVTQFNSPQRLSAVASMVNGVDMFIAPKEGGLADIYMNGELVAPDRNLGAIIDDLRTQVDEGYRTKQAEFAAAQAEADLKARTDIQIALAKARLDAGNVVLETDANTGDIVVFDKLQQRMIGVITRTNPTNPEQVLPAPTFVPIN